MCCSGGESGQLLRADSGRRPLGEVARSYPTVGQVLICDVRIARQFPKRNY